MTDFSPMLAVTAPANLKSLFRDLPRAARLVVQPKLDGVRALVRNSVVLSRSLKPIPNAHVQHLYGRSEYEGFDGELIVGNPGDGQTFRRTTAAVMARGGEPLVGFVVFDKFDLAQPYKVRRDAISQINFSNNEAGHHYLTPSTIGQHTVDCADDIYEHYKDWIAQGLEGLILRRNDAPYKFGRSTQSEAYLLKLKPAKDAEARVIGFSALVPGNGPPQDLAEPDRLGALQCKNKHGQIFNIGTGFSEWERRDFWSNRGSLLHQIVKYSYSPGQYTNAPRHPVFLGFRHRKDL